MIGIEQVVILLLVAGATEVHIDSNLARSCKLPKIHNEEELNTFLKKKWKATDFMVMAWHPLGTARISATPKDGVCDKDHKVFGYEGLYVMDGGSVPSSLGVNPQITIMSLAMKASEKLSKKLYKKYEEDELTHYV